MPGSACFTLRGLKHLLYAVRWHVCIFHILIFNYISYSWKCPHRGNPENFVTRNISKLVSWNLIKKNPFGEKSNLLKVSVSESRIDLRWFSWKLSSARSRKTRVSHDSWLLASLCLGYTTTCVFHIVRRRLSSKTRLRWMIHTSYDSCKSACSEKMG